MNNLNQKCLCIIDFLENIDTYKVPKALEVFWDYDKYNDIYEKTEFNSLDLEYLLKMMRSLKQ